MGDGRMERGRVVIPSERSERGIPMPGLSRTLMHPDSSLCSE